MLAACSSRTATAQTSATAQPIETTVAPTASTTPAVTSMVSATIAPKVSRNIASTPSEFEAKYNGLLQNSKISNAMVWTESSGFKTYNNWSLDQKNQFMDVVIGFETGKPFPIKEPPKLTKDKYISENDAWMIYLTHVAHTLWLEANHLVNWSILDYSPDELKLLLESDRMLGYYGPEFGYYFDQNRMGIITDWNIDISYNFMQTKGYLKEDQESTVYAFATWIRNSVEHISGPIDADTFEQCYGYRGFPLVDKILYPIYTDHGFSVSAGCWGTTGLFSALMRSVNIPVASGISNLGIPGATEYGVHSRIELPTINKGLVHSDDLYDRWCKPCGGNVVPTDKLFHALDWLRDNIDNPTTIDSSAAYTNRKEDQASYNSNKYTEDLAVSYLSDYLLYLRVTDANNQNTTSTDNLINQLSGVSVGGSIIKFAKPFYSDAELAAIIKSVDGELTKIGGGNWDQGAEIVRKRLS